ncbi:MAG: SDR family NAD(P)-dependent oxidoreductase [Bacilli bacterium]
MEKWAVITGASSGVGEAYARALAEQKINILIGGRRIEKLLALREELQRIHSVQVEYIVGDLCENEVLKVWQEKIDQLPHVEWMVNNAGFGGVSSFSEGTLENHQKMTRLHIDVCTALSYCAAQKMKKQRRGKIINVASLAAFYYFPDATMYCASKAYILSFSKCLKLEMLDYNVSVQVLCPGFVHTDFHEKIGMDTTKMSRNVFLPWSKPDVVVQKSIAQAYLKAKTIVIPGVRNKLLHGVSGIVPTFLYERVATKSWSLLK